MKTSSDRPVMTRTPHPGYFLSQRLPYSAQSQLQLPLGALEDQLLTIAPQMELFKTILPDHDLVLAESLPESWSVLAPSMMHAFKIADNDAQLFDQFVQVRDAIEGKVLRQQYWPNLSFAQLLTSLDMMSESKLIPVDIWTLDAMLGVGVVFPQLPTDKTCLVVLPCLLSDQTEGKTMCVVLEADKGKPIRILLKWIYDVIFLQYGDTEVFALGIESEYLLKTP